MRTRTYRKPGLARWLAREARLFVLIMTNLALLFLTWLLVLGLIPGDLVGFNVTGSLVVIAVAAAPSYYLNRYVNRLLGYR